MRSRRRHLHIERPADEDFGEIIVSALSERAKRTLSRRFLAKMLAVALALTLNAIGLGAITGKTLAFYVDEEFGGISATAAFLDFRLTEDELVSLIGVEETDEKNLTTVALEEPGSLPVQYTIATEQVGGDADVCNGLLLEVKKNGIEIHDGDVLSFAEATTTVFGTFEFYFDLPPSVANIGHGETCEADAVFSGWRAAVENPSESGFTDEERVHFAFTSKMIVLNEIIPNPTGSDSQTGIAGEWVELYNNGDTAVDVAGWQISELSDPQGTPSENFYTITASSSSATQVRTMSGNTVISPGGFLVLLFDAARMNNTGDTVSLYDGASVLMDAHSYVGQSAPEGKSIARIPDGIGAWVDPVPTPGAANKLEEETEQPPTSPTALLSESETATDTVPPELTINGNNPAFVEVGNSYGDLGAYAYDEYEGKQRFVDTVENTVDTQTPGQYYVKYSVRDAAGNGVIGTRVVVVYNPEFGQPDADTVIVPDYTYFTVEDSPAALSFEQEPAKVEEATTTPETTENDTTSENGDEPAVTEDEERKEPEPVVEEPVEEGPTGDGSDTPPTQESGTEDSLSDQVTAEVDETTEGAATTTEETATSTEEVIIEEETATSTPEAPAVEAEEEEPVLDEATTTDETVVEETPVAEDDMTEATEEVIEPTPETQTEEQPTPEETALPKEDEPTVEETDIDTSAAL